MYSVRAVCRQTGKRHDNTKVLKGFGGASVLEVIESQAGNTYRAVYTVRFAAAVIVLHVFQKNEVRYRDSETRYGSDRGRVKEGY